MIKRQNDLWDNLMKLTETNEAFYYMDQQLDSTWYRCFSYRLASYTDFLEPDALECRGVLFEISEEGENAKVIRLAVWTPSKFFNINENPFTENLDFSDVKTISLKMDGSLISTFIHNGELHLKSKGSLHSDHVKAATKWLNLDDNVYLKEELTNLTKDEHTFNMEWCSPEYPFRIVIGYDNPGLTILNVRNIKTGDYISFQELSKKYKNDCAEIMGYWVELISIIKPEEFVNEIPNLTGIEGYVIELNDGMIVKSKTIEYVTKHRCKDNVNNPKRLFEAVLEEVTDDLRVLFVGDDHALKTIEEMELKVDKLYNSLVSRVEKFYKQNKTMERKEYAILGLKELDRMAFNLVMSLYLGKDVDYKEYMKKNFKHFGISEVL